MIENVTVAVIVAVIVAIDVALIISFTVAVKRYKFQICLSVIYQWAHTLCCTAE